MTITVEAQEADSGSLLSLYRRLIHLRKSNQALGVGRLVPLSTENSSVAAYLRREGDQAVMVVANMTGEAISGVTIGSGPETLPQGSYEPQNLLWGPGGAALEVASDGRLDGYSPRPGGLGPREVLVLELVRR
jgi:glycosidase